MKFRTILLFTFVVPLLAQQDECGPNQVHSCVRYCKQTCSNPNITCEEVPGCPRKTCHCKQNFLLNSENVCVPKSQCPSNVVGNVRPSADSTVQRVANAVAGVLCLFEKCTTTAAPRTTTTTAATTTTTTSKNSYNGCGANQQRVSCGTPCEPTCFNPRPICVQSCLVNVCQCKLGYYRDGNRCIKASDCPAFQPAVISSQPSVVAEPQPSLRPYIPDHRPYYGMVTRYRVCPAKEIYAVCIPCERTCDSTNWLCHNYCIDGCTCDQERGYYYRDRSTGECVNKCPAINTYSYNYWYYQQPSYVAPYYVLPRRGQSFEQDLNMIFENVNTVEDQFKTK